MSIRCLTSISFDQHWALSGAKVESRGEGEGDHGTECEFGCEPRREVGGGR